MRIIFKWFLSSFFLSLILLISSQACADINRQRQDFLAAEKAIRKGSVHEMNQLLPGLKNYPLYPYLVYEQIRRNISLSNEERILSFFNVYESTPLSDRLRQSWLEYLSANDQWSRLIRDYRRSSSQALQCSYARALLESGQKEQAWKEAENLWLNGRSMPRQCDPVFDSWRDHGGLTPVLVWQRIELAMNQDQKGLARYLGRYLPDNDKSWLDLWLKVMDRPLMVLGINWSDTNHWTAENILAMGMSRLIRDDTQKALKQWKNLEADNDLKHIDTSSIRQELGLFLTLRKHPEALEYISSLPETEQTPTLKEWRIRNALYHQNWPEALAALNRLDDSQQQTDRWTYWRGRVLEQMGLDNQARGFYQSILGKQNYYSLLAADRLNQPGRFEHRTISAHGQDILNIRRDPGIMRAQELYYLGRMVDARREWNAALSGKSGPETRAAALLAHNMGWNDRAIVAAANVSEFADLVVRFPVSYSDLINSYSRTRGLDPAWVFAVARQESMFMADVGSPAGALGIMQIMPGTGRQIAAAKRIRFGGRYMLLDPETNIRFGTYYLKKRLEEFQNNPVLATAAYNAGAHRVRAWLPDDRSMPADIWVENIPFFETRDYVEKVFTYRMIYEQRLGVPFTRIASVMPDIQGKNTVSAKADF